MCEARLIWQRTGERKPPRSFRKLSSIAELSSAIRSVRWRSCNWRGHTQYPGDLTRAKSAYGDFLKLWKGADPEIPVLEQAKTEYAKVQ
jgi:hypothetical protein